MPPILKGSYKRNTCIITELRGDWDDSLCILKIGEMIIVLIVSDSTRENALPNIASQVIRFQETVNLSRSLWYPQCSLIYNGLKELM